MGIVVLGLLVGLDNLAVSTGVGMLGLQRRRRLAFAFSCMLFETIMPLVGFQFGAGLREVAGGAGEWIGPASLLVCGMLVFLAAARRNAIPPLLDRPAAMVLIPLLLSFDNLAAGTQLGASGGGLLAGALMVGVLSGAACLLGFVIGDQVRNRLPRRSGYFAAAWFVGCAALLVLVDRS